MKLAGAHFQDAFSGSTLFYVGFILKSIMAIAISNLESYVIIALVALVCHCHMIVMFEDAVSTLFGVVSPEVGDNSSVVDP